MEGQTYGRTDRQTMANLGKDLSQNAEPGAEVGHKIASTLQPVRLEKVEGEREKGRKVEGGSDR